MPRFTRERPPKLVMKRSLMSTGKKRGSVTYSTDRENEVIVRYLLYLRG